MTPRKRTLTERLRSVYLWHRYAGLVAALLAIVLSVTGLLLNHSNALRLDSRYVQADWLLTAYNIEVPEPLAHRVGDHWVTALGDRLYVDSTAVARDRGEFLTAVPLDGMFVIVLEKQLLLFDERGWLLERFPAPASIRAAGLTTDGRLGLRTANGTLIADAELLEWQHVDDTPLRVLSSSDLPESLRAELATRYRGTAITWERVLLDVHSGRLLGKVGVYLADAAAILLLLLAITGIVVWWQRRASRLEHRRAQPGQ